MNESVFLSALHESPNDEVTWLALADWLEENGQSDRAELVRLVRRLRTIPLRNAFAERAAAEDRVAELLLAGVRPVVPEFVNSLGMRLALIPPGTFRLGGWRNETRAIKSGIVVELTTPFYLSVFTVTQEEYQSVMGVNPSRFSASGEAADQVTGLDTSRFPVEHMSWTNASKFCQALETRDRKAGLDISYRLPSEAEWEYACRGGSASTTAFYFGHTLDSTQANFNGDSPSGKGAKRGPVLGHPCAVGSYLPNVFGLYDMHGNVSEWTADWFANLPRKGPLVDPTGPVSGAQRVVRNGSAGDMGSICKSFHRIEYGGGSPNGYLGFRVVAAWPIERIAK